MRAVTLIALISLPPGAILYAACTSSIYRINTADSITLHSTSFSNSALQTAAAGWNNCSQAGEGFPNIVVGSNGEMHVEVSLIAGNNPDSGSNGCGSFIPTVVAGGTKPLISGGQIKIYEKTYPGADCSSNYSETITHELGHALGLGNATSTSCDGNMMGAGKLVTNPDGTKSVVPSRTVKGIECYAANKQFFMDDETSPPEPSPSSPNPPSCYDCGPESPIVIQFDNGSFDLSGPENAVTFDIDADGVPDHTAWLSRERQQAFLARDLNGNGIVDNGRELFGNSTQLADGTTAKHGFEVLLELDSNRDAVIDHQDAIWTELRLWFDRNHDGATDGGELLAISDSAVKGVSLHYRTTNRRDQYGNLLRYKSSAEIMKPNGTLVTRPIYDVFFVQAFD